MIEGRVLRLLTPSRIKHFDRLQLGAGPHPLPGWANVDLGGKNLRWDLRKPLPLKPGSLRLVYSEHFIEHVTRSDGLMILCNCHRAMVKGGTIRISTPDLRVIATDYLEGRTVRMDHGAWYPETPCQMLNEGVRFWGHTFMYDEPELRALLQEAGFRDIQRVSWGESENAELRGRETRPDFKDLILEAKA
jgi:predicted SAM-dependent methyltransferase